MTGKTSEQFMELEIGFQVTWGHLGLLLRSPEVKTPVKGQIKLDFPTCKLSAINLLRGLEICLNQE